MKRKNFVLGVVFVVLAVGLSAWVMTLGGSVLEMLVGKAVWYVPYVALVAGVDQFVRAFRNRGVRSFHGRSRPMSSHCL